MSIKQFVEESGLDNTLARAVIRQIGGWDTFKESARDVANHGADGGFGGFIYYSDTVPFAKSVLEPILAYCREMAESLGEGDEFALIAGFNCVDLTPGEVARAIYDSKSDDRTTVLNALAWFALEEVARRYDDLAS